MTDFREPLQKPMQRQGNGQINRTAHLGPREAPDPKSNLQTAVKAVVTMDRREALKTIGLALALGGFYGVGAKFVSEQINKSRSGTREEELRTVLNTLEILDSRLRECEKTYSLKPGSLNIAIEKEDSKTTGVDIRLNTVKEDGRRKTRFVVAYLNGSNSFRAIGLCLPFPAELSEELTNEIKTSFTKSIGNDLIYMSKIGKLLDNYLVQGSIGENVERLTADLNYILQDRYSHTHWRLYAGFVAGVVLVLLNKIRNRLKLLNEASKYTKKKRRRKEERLERENIQDTAATPNQNTQNSGNYYVSNEQNGADIRTRELTQNATAAGEKHRIPIEFLRALDQRGIVVEVDEYKVWYDMYKPLKKTGIEPYEIGMLLIVKSALDLNDRQLLDTAHTSSRLKNILEEGDRSLAVFLSAGLVAAAQDTRSIKQIKETGRLGFVIEMNWDSLNARLSAFPEGNKVLQLAERLRPSQSPGQESVIFVQDLVDAQESDLKVCEDIARLLANLSRDRPFVNEHRISFKQIQRNLPTTPVRDLDDALKHLETLGYVEKIVRGRAKKSEPSYSAVGGSELHKRITEARLKLTK